MEEKKKTGKEQLMEKLEPMEEAVKAASQTVKEAAEKAAPAVKAAGRSVKEAAWRAGPAVKKAAEKAGPAVKSAGRTIRETGKKAASAIVPEIYFQWQGREVLCSALVDQAKAAYRAENKAAVRSCRIYIKPEDGAVYYVINGTEGKFAL